MKSKLKWVLLALFAMAGGYFALSAPETVEIFLPTVEVVRAEESEHFEQVSGLGTITLARDISGDTWMVCVVVNESDIGNVEVGQRATLSGAAISDGVYTATVNSISNVARQQTNGFTYETVVDVVLTIDNPDEHLRSGYTAQARIATGELRQILTVPYSVIRQDDEGEYVYVLQNHRAIRRNIVTGAELAEGAELLGGLMEADEIITVPDEIMPDALVKKYEGEE